MSAADIVQRWISERDAAIEADIKGVERPLAPSIATGSWFGSATVAQALQVEAQVLRFLQRELDSEAEVEAAKAEAPVVVAEQAPRSAAKAMLQAYLDGDCGDAADGILDALGWPT